MNTLSIVFGSEIFASICLVENDDSSRLQVFRLESASSCDSEPEGKVVKVVDTNGSVLRDVFGHSGDMGLDDMITVEERHFTAGFDPNFMFGVLGHEVETGDAESELAGFGELADINAGAEQFLFGDVGAEGHQLAIDVEDFALNQTEHRLLDWVLYQVLQSVPDVLVQLGEQHFRLLVGQRAHLPSC